MFLVTYPAAARAIGRRLCSVEHVASLRRVDVGQNRCPHEARADDPLVADFASGDATAFQMVVGFAFRQPPASPMALAPQIGVSRSMTAPLPVVFSICAYRSRELLPRVAGVTCAEFVEDGQTGDPVENSGHTRSEFLSLSFHTPLRGNGTEGIRACPGRLELYRGRSSQQPPAC